MAWPFSRRVAELLPAIPVRRYATVGAVVLCGVLLSLAVWFRAERQRHDDIIAMLSANADRATSQLEWAMGRQVAGLRSFAEIWRVHNPDSSDTWPVEAGILLEQFPALQRVAWMTSDTTVLAFVGRDTTTRIDPELLWQARLQLSSSAALSRERWAGSYEFSTILTVRRNSGGLGAVIAEFRFDSSWVNREQTTNAIPAARMIAEDGHSVELRSQQITTAPTWMRMKRALTTPAGNLISVEWVPSDQLVRQLMSPWPVLFVFAGGLFSLAVGALMFSFLRQRDFSSALQTSNLQLNTRITELSTRDRELHELNEELAERVNQRTAALARALSELETLNHSVSHDLRSPIGAILNFTAVLEEDLGPKLGLEERRFLARIRAAASRANQLLDSLSEYMASGPSSTGNGSSTLGMVPLDMSTLVHGALSEAQGRDGGTSRLEFTMDPLPTPIGDPALVHRVLVNLLGNALKYSRDRDPRKVHVAGCVDSGECVYSIIDNGRGFAPAQAGEIFQPFRRLHESDVEGSGLGLAIVSRLITGMGGRVWAESDGATKAALFFTLPRAEERIRDDQDNPAG